jgi:NO-binding membrane sensor protein with MHYT domain
MPMPEMTNFAYGAVNPVIAFAMALVGAVFGLACTARAQRTLDRGHRLRWLLFAGIALGGVGIWLMHFMAMLGFDVPAGHVRYNVPFTALSLVMAIVIVECGLLLVGLGRPNMPKILVGGLFTGVGVAAMHYTGMYALRLDGRVDYQPRLVAASVLIAVIAATVALWFTVSARGPVAIGAASVIFAVAVCAMHYTGMTAVRVHLDPTESVPPGAQPIMLVVPIVIITVLALLAMLFAGLTMMSDDETVPPPPAPVPDPFASAPTRPVLPVDVPRRRR